MANQLENHNELAQSEILKKAFWEKNSELEEECLNFCDPVKVDEAAEKFKKSASLEELHHKPKDFRGVK